VLLKEHQALNSFYDTGILLVKFSNNCSITMLGMCLQAIAQMIYTAISLFQ